MIPPGMAMFVTRDEFDKKVAQLTNVGEGLLELTKRLERKIEELEDKVDRLSPFAFPGLGP